MRKLTALLLLPLLASCGPQRIVEDQNPDNLPVYCVRGIEAFEDEGYALIDMPGLYYGRDDEPIEVSYEHYMSTYVLGEREGAPFCAFDDPRMTETND